MNFDDFDLTDNGDGTFTLTPKNPVTDQATLIAEYRSIRDQAATLLAHRDEVIAKLQALAARRDEIRALLVTSGVGNPDDDQ